MSGSFLAGVILIGIIIWVVAKIFSPKDKTSDTVSSPSDSANAVNKTSSQRNFYGDKAVRTDNDSFWVKPGETAYFLEYTISGGMIYVGTGLAAPAGYGAECALLDPRLPVSTSNCDYRVRKLDYWPSYADASPDARGAYLRWLTNGKNDPAADIGYVFLYFYGLERRMLHDIDYSPTAKNEIYAIRAEIERLLAIYGGNGSFHTYANSLLAYMKADEYIKSAIYTQAAPAATYHAGIPLDLRAGLGQIARDRAVVPPDWALSWYLSAPNPPVFARTAAQRCTDEFQKAFAEEYEKVFGAGLKLTPNKTKLAFAYQPANKSLLGSRTYAKVLDLPDVTVLTSQIKKLAPVVQNCHDRLDSYSRFLGRNPGKAGTLDALLELPSSLWPTTVKQAINELQAAVSKSSQPQVIKLASLLANFPDWQDRSKKRMGLFLDALSHSYHIGIEPDCRLGGALPAADSSVVIFDLGQDSHAAVPGARYAAASVAMYLSVLVSQADGKVSAEELAMLLYQADHQLDLQPAERQRLKAHTLWLSAQNLNMSSLKKRIESLDAAHKELIGNMIVQVSQVDGTVSVEEMKLIERIFKLLGIVSTNLYSKMHQAALEPVTVTAAAAAQGGFVLSAPPEKAAASPMGTVKLDMSKVAALQADSDKATSILSAIFSEEKAPGDTASFEQVSHDESPPVESAGKCLWGLPPALVEFVQTLCGKQSWERSEIEEIAEDRGLMLAGALEQINDAAYDKFDQAFTEGDDSIEINQEIVKVMKA